MSGHSKWSKIKRGKAITDAKRGKIFSKMARIISVAAREKGPDPKFNPSLRMAIEKAKEANMPNDNIDRAIAKASGGDGDTTMEEFLYEAYGPGGIALLIEGLTDNKNRTLTEIKNILNKNNAKFVESGGVKYLFQRKGVIIVSNEQKNLGQDNLELAVIEAGAENIKLREDNTLEVHTPVETMEEVRNNLERKNIPVESFSLDWVAANEIEITSEKTKEQIEKLVDALEEQDDVNEIYSNLKSQLAVE
jgi:YebC/PmpR family DNA-binding regulatory protein